MSNSGQKTYDASTPHQVAFLVLRKLFARPADQEESPDDVNRY